MVLDVALGGGLGLVFDLCFVALCVAVALLVRPRDFFTVGVLPPLLMLGVFVLLDVARPEVLGHPQDGVVQSVVTGLAHHSGALVSGYLLCLAVLAIRHRVTAQAAKRSGSPAPTPHDLRVALRPVDDRRRLGTGLACLDHDVDLVVELLLDLPAEGPRLLLARQDQGAGQDRLAQLLEQRADHDVVGDPDADGALLGVHQPARHLAGRRQDERVGPGRGRLDRPERRVVDVDELPELGEVPAHQREVVPVVELPDPQDPVAAVPVAELAAQRVAGVGRVGDQRVVAQRLDDLGDQPGLRVDRVEVEVARHGGEPTRR